MDRQLERRKSRKRVAKLQSENGYLMLSTLFLLVLIGIFMQSMIKISSNHIVQLNQIASSYQARTALNLTVQSVSNYIDKNDGKFINRASFLTSVGKVKIKQLTHNKYRAILIQEDGFEYTKIFEISSLETDAETKIIEVEQTIDSEVENSL